MGCLDIEPFENAHCYTLTDPSEHAEHFPGAIERTELRALDPAIDRVSLAIHHHRSLDEAQAYFKGLSDYGVDFGAEPICRTEQDIFTLITRRTKPNWPGPLIAYIVDHVPADTIIGEDSWEVTIAPDGTLIEQFSDFSDFK